jgi:hypothetical protein
MNRWVWFGICAVFGAGLFGCGLLVPAHLRAVDVRVIEQAGRNSPALTEKGLALLNANNLGAAQMLSKAARETSLPDSETLAGVAGNMVKEHPDWQVWGGPEPLPFSANDTGATNLASQPFTEIMIHQVNRERVLQFLRSSPSAPARELLRCRELTNTTIFPPSFSSSGQAFDAALGIGGLLLEEGRLSKGLSLQMATMCATAVHGGSPQPLEYVLMDLMSLGERLNWGQLVAFAGKIGDSETLRILASRARAQEDQLPELFSMVEVSGKPDAVAAYLMKFAETGFGDLRSSLRFGAGGLNELLRCNMPLHTSALPGQIALDYCWRTPGFALSLKWFLYLAGGFLLAAAMHFARPAVPELEQPLQVRGFHFAREILFALGFLFVVLLLSEPFLAQESQKAEMPFRLRLPMVGSAAPAEAGAQLSLMNAVNPVILLTLALFFVLQGLLYIGCLVKLAEIRRQRVAPRVKLRLLENEEHLFDAGLYLGFAGTIVSLILVSVGVIKQPTLMAAYSSTAFGIIFVCIFKIFHLRPARRRLLLESEIPAAEQQRVAPGVGAAYATSP